MDSAERAGRIIRTVVEELQPGFAVRLWNGERIGPPDGPVLVINDRGIVGRVAAASRLHDAGRTLGLESH